nr:DUF2314 domain-containing protein [Campylobacter suis]
MPMFYIKSGEDKMQDAYEMACAMFGYFWRGLFWEYRRIVPALDAVCVKVLLRR